MNGNAMFSSYSAFFPVYSRVWGVRFIIHNSSQAPIPPGAGCACQHWTLISPGMERNNVSLEFTFDIQPLAPPFDRWKK